MIAELAWHLRCSTLDAAILIGQMRSKLEASGLHERVADRMLRRVVADALKSMRPLDLMKLQVDFIVKRQHDRATSALMATPIVARSEKQRARYNYVRRQRRTDERRERKGVRA